jgi:uncharacterized membrane protein
MKNQKLDKGINALIIAVICVAVCVSVLAIFIVILSFIDYILT